MAREKNESPVETRQEDERENLHLIPPDDDPYPTARDECVRIRTDKETIHGEYLGITHEGICAYRNFLDLIFHDKLTDRGEIERTVTGARINPKIAYIPFRRVEEVKPFSREELERMVEEINAKKKRKK